MTEDRSLRGYKATENSGFTKT